MPGTHTSSYPTTSTVDVLVRADRVGLVELVGHARESPRERAAVAAADRVHDPVVGVERGDADAGAGGRPATSSITVVGDLVAERRAEPGERAVVLVRLERRLQLGADDAPMRTGHGDRCGGRPDRGRPR